MKKPILIFYLLTLIGLSFPTSMGAQTPTTDNIVLSDLAWDNDLEFYFFDVSLEGSRIYTAYNMDIFLPDGISTDKDYVLMTEEGSEGIYPCTYNKIKKEYTYTHGVSASMPSTNQLRIACTSDINEEFTETSGTLFRVYVELDETKFTFSPKPIVTVSGIGLVVKEGAQKYVPADFSCRPFSTGIPASRTLPLNINAANKIGTLILPFDADLPEGVKAYTCDAADEGTKTLTLTAASSFKACTPYIVYAPSGYSGNISGTVDLSATYPDEDIYAEGYLTGVLSPTVVNTGYIMQNQGDGPMFYDADGSNFSLPAGRCYLTPPTALLSKAFGFSFEEVNAIGAVIDKSPISNELYDLSGRRVVQPTKGIYIQDRKKVFIK